MVAGPGRGGVLARLGAARMTLGSEMRAYRSLPTFPGESARSDQLQADVREIFVALDALEAATSGQRAADINVDEVHAAVDRASDTANALIDLNAKAADDLALDIEAIRRTAERAAFGLDTLCVFFCLVGGYLAWRTNQLYLHSLEAQRLLQEARATELEAFSGRVAHDIVSPLSTVTIALGMIRRHGATASVMDRASSAVARVDRIVDGLLFFAKAGAQPDPDTRSSVESVLKEVFSDLSPVASAGRATLEVEGRVAGEVACHPGVLASLLTNLIGNALKYLGDASERRVVVRVQPSDRRVRFEIEDTGMGISADLVDSVFEPFVRGRVGDSPGIGLGLATVKKLCTAHGGMVGLRSTPGRGTLIWFELPAPAEVREVASASPPQAAVRTH